MKSIRQICDVVFNCLSGEWLLKHWGNGGFIIFLRSLQVSLELFSIALLTKSWIDAGPGSEFSLEVARKITSENFEWLGALFAGCYVAFYSRFSGQWSYLADLYNQIMSVKCTIDQNGHSSNLSLVKWQVGFIADAHTLHLDRKELFSSVIVSMLEDPVVLKQFKATVGSDAQLIMERVRFKEKIPKPESNAQQVIT